eukprot:290206-Pyramimonas_sp.AAC.1
MAQDSARSLKMSSTMPPKGLKRATRHKTVEGALADPSGPPREAKTQHLQQTQGNVTMCAPSPFLFRCASQALRWHRKAPRRAHEAPMTTPRAPNSAPTEAQERPKGLS